CSSDLAGSGPPSCSGPLPRSDLSSRSGPPSASGPVSSGISASSAPAPSGRHSDAPASSAGAGAGRSGSVRATIFLPPRSLPRSYQSAHPTGRDRLTRPTVQDGGMDLRIFTEPQQGATYDTLLTVAKATETLGFDGFFRSDHYLKMGSVDGLPGPTDAWITLAGLARETRRIRLGTLMTAATFRLPGVLAVQVAQVDQMSGGRIELGLGAGWFEEEHRAYGIPFPKEKFARLEEQLEIVTGLWATEPGRTFDHHGTYYDLTGSPALPKPAQAKVPVLIGGHGAKRTPRLAARFADEFNMPFASVEDTVRQFTRVRDA